MSHESTPSRYLIRPETIAPYHPANHHGTANRRLIGPGNVGARQMEVVLGRLEKGGGALPHAHPGIEQACYLLEGTARVTVGDETFDLAPGEMCFFPADVMHVFSVTSEQPVKLLVIYSPPYGEAPEKVIRPAA